VAGLSAALKLEGADLNPAAAFRRIVRMNDQAFTSNSLTMMYEAIRGALAADGFPKLRTGGRTTCRFE
jgi:hypothetical protein